VLQESAYAAALTWWQKMRTYISIGEQEKSELVPSLMLGISTLPAQHQDMVLRMAVKVKNPTKNTSLFAKLCIV
jgi:hypothetical protein